MLLGYYAYCRTWLGFTEKFPHFDELNSFPDDTIVSEIETRALSWWRSNKSAVQKKYRKKRAQLQEVDPLSRPGIAVRSGPSELEIKLTERLNNLSPEELTQLAKKLLESHGSNLLKPGPDLDVPKLRQAVLDFLYPLLIRPKSRDATIAILPPSFGTFFPVLERIATIVKHNMRGDRSDFSVRILRVARWMEGTQQRLGGLSPSHTLYLGRLSNEKLARHVLDACRIRSELINWHKDMQLHYGFVPAETLGVARCAAIDRSLSELPSTTDRWTGTPLHQVVYCHYNEMLSSVNETQLPAVAPPTQAAISARTADEAIQMLHCEWATYTQLSKVTGIKEPSLRGAVRNARNNDDWLPETNERDLPLTSSHSSRIEFRVRPLWRFLPRCSARAQKKSSSKPRI